MRRRRGLRLRGVVYATWASPDRDPANWPDWIGLNRETPDSILAKPALAHFARAARAVER